MEQKNDERKEVFTVKDQIKMMKENGGDKKEAAFFFRVVKKY
ncbi:hypothetical protein [Chitinophaga sp. 22620]